MRHTAKNFFLSQRGNQYSNVTPVEKERNNKEKKNNINIPQHVLDSPDSIESDLMTFTVTLDVEELCEESPLPQEPPTYMMKSPDPGYHRLTSLELYAYTTVPISPKNDVPSLSAEPAASNRKFALFPSIACDWKRKYILIEKKMEIYVK